jgi:ribosomal protein L11 methyltransferase
VGKLTIVPCDDDAAPDASPTRLQIVPGTGFGTGHHATTFLILELLQQPLFTQPPPQSVLDVGTGSGILALAARKLFQARVTGIDIDDLALDNARTNARLNACGDLALSATPIEATTGSFNLIVANIYAEVLQTLSPDFARLLSPGGALIVSGIMHSLADPLLVHFERNGWTLKERREREGWVAIVFARAQ